MLDSLKDNSLVICPNNIKLYVLKYLTNNKLLINLKFMTMDDFKDNYFGTYKDEALYYLINNYTLNYDVALDYLQNLFYKYDKLQKIYDDLEQNALLIFNPYFKDEIKNKNIYLIGYDNLDSYLANVFKQLNASKIKLINNNYKPNVYEFDEMDKEISFVASDIIQNKYKLSDVYLVNLDANYEYPIKRIFKMFHIGINYNSTASIYGTINGKKFIDNLKMNKDLSLGLKDIENTDLYDEVVNVINKYHIPNTLNDNYIYLIKNILKNIKVKNEKKLNAVNVINYDEIFEEDKIYYFMNFNEGNVLKNIDDNLLIKDNIRSSLGLNTSIERIILEKQKINNIIKNYAHLTITYKLKDNFLKYLPSSLINDNNLAIQKNVLDNYNYSNAYNQYKLGLILDDYYKFNMENSELNPLLLTYPNNDYQSYDNAFKGIDTNLLMSFLNNKTNLSYSSLDNYYRCAFRFYISNILKLDPFKDTFMTFIGNLYHFVLSHMYDQDFSLKDAYEEYVNKSVLTSKEKFFVHKLYANLEMVIKTIKEQDQHSTFKEVMTEKHIAIDKSHILNVNFLGFIDKIKYLEKDSTMWVAIIDYKTGTPMTTLDNINYGLHMQLPIYIYLTKKGLHKNVKIAGFYLQKIINPPKLDSNNLEDDSKKSLKWEGYTINNDEIITLLDSTNEASEMIKGLGKNVSGEYKKSAKLISDEDIEKIIAIVDQHIDEVILNIEEGNFKINPKRIDDDLVGCEYCNFKDICFRKEEDIVNLVNTKKSAILGGEDNDEVDD